MKGVQICRPFIYGTTARQFDEKTNPKPPGVPDGHTHSWQVFIKGVDDVDITYWLRKVQFKFHESIPNPIRSECRSSAPRLWSSGRSSVSHAPETGYPSAETRTSANNSQ